MITETLKEISENFRNLSENYTTDIENASKIIIDSLTRHGKLLICGNGGSASDSQHIAAELIVKYRKERKPIAALALTTDTSILTACANDFSFDDIFSRQIEALGQSGDVLLAISTSGKSRNILKAISVARKKCLKVICLTGQDGGDMNNICDQIIKVPSIRPDRIQEMHIGISQILCELIESKLT